MNPAKMLTKLASSLAFPRARSSYYVVCSTQRTGSTLLCSLLSKLGRFGRPLEYFDTTVVAPTVLEQLGLPKNQIEENLEAYIAALKEHFTSPHGVFGLKTHFSDYHKATARGLDLPRHFPGARFIHCTRVDVIRQAISAEKANQTKCWAWFQKPQSQAVYDAQRISRAIFNSHSDNLQWQRFFEARNTLPYSVIYEHLVQDVSRGLAGVAQFLGQQLPQEELQDVKSPMKRQSDAINQQWYERYLQDLNAMCNHKERAVAQGAALAQKCLARRPPAAREAA